MQVHECIRSTGTGILPKYRMVSYACRYVASGVRRFRNFCLPLFRDLSAPRVGTYVITEGHHIE